MQRANRWYRAAGVPGPWVLALVVGLGAVGLGETLWAQDRGQSVVGPATSAPAATSAPVHVEIKGTYKALLIGIDKYAHTEDLKGAVKDVEAVRAVLAERYGFDPDYVKLLLNEQATKSHIIDALYEVGKQAGTDDSVFIYYAGHGQYDGDGAVGWWVPTDGYPKRAGTLIKNATILSYIEDMRARHVYLVVDSCFSGSLFGTRALPPIDDRFYATLYEGRSRWGLSSGANEPVDDAGLDGHSPFAFYFLKTLRENEAPYLVPTEIHKHVGGAVMNYTHQTPLSQPLRKSRHKSGQFVFRLTGVQPQTVKPGPSPGGGAEVAVTQHLSQEDRKPKCPGQEGASCWQELTDKPSCYVWNVNPKRNETVTWSGSCSGGLAEGKGTLTWNSGQEDSGTLVSGKPHGRWVKRDSDGDVSEGHYVDGKRHGPWVLRFGGDVEEGTYENGKKHGRWVTRDSKGGMEEGTYENGKKHGRWVERTVYKGKKRERSSEVEGPYVNGQRHGRWVKRTVYKDKKRERSSEVEGPYVNGKQHGHWVARGQVVYYKHKRWERSSSEKEGPYVDGEKHGRWVERTVYKYKGKKRESSSEAEGPYVNGKRHGRWVKWEVFPSGRTSESEGPYVDGEKHGRWVTRDSDGDIMEEGPYVDGKQHGRWVTRDSDGDIMDEGPYVNGEKHGRWVERYSYKDGTTSEHEGPYVNGYQHGRWVTRWSDGSCESIRLVQDEEVDGSERKC